jgi:hypothetical protein
MRMTEVTMKESDNDILSIRKVWKHDHGTQSSVSFNLASMSFDWPSIDFKDIRIGRAATSFAEIDHIAGVLASNHANSRFHVALSESSLWSDLLNQIYFIRMQPRDTIPIRSPDCISPTGIDKLQPG